MESTADEMKQKIKYLNGKQGSGKCSSRKEFKKLKIRII